jgi:hypothetical protein
MLTLKSPLKLTLLTLSLAGFFVLQAWPTIPGRMTGGGDFISNNTLITFGTEVHCDTTTPNNLEINWNGNHFHLDVLPYANCYLLGNPTPPPAPFNTFLGTGYGSYNGTPGYHIDFVLQDNGEPGRNDVAEFYITAPNGDVVLATNPTALQSGNLQAHKDTGNG